MLKIHEVTLPNGELSGVFLRFEAGQLELVDHEGAFALPGDALPAVMSRFGAPFDTEAEIAVIASLELGDGSLLRHVRHLAGYDVIARDYLVYEAEGREALCVIATTIAGALAHLARVALRARSTAP
jgi:hypothetical protein